MAAVVIEEREDELGRVIDVGRDAIAQEFQIAERLDAKARNLLTTAGSWFAVAQAVAGLTLDAAAVQRGWLIAVVALAGVGAIFVVATLWRVSRVWTLQPEMDIVPDALFLMADRARSEDKGFVDELVHHYAAVLASRRLNNATRASHATRAERVWLVAVTVPLVEILAALAGMLSS